MASEFLQPPGWTKPKGYSNGMSVSGRQICLAGLIGWNEIRNIVSSAPGRASTASAAEHRRAARASGSASRASRPPHLVRHERGGVRAELKEIGAAYRDVIGRYYPPMSVVQVVRLVEGDAKVEIEATAVIPQ